jgi:hypothetical protein
LSGDKGAQYEGYFQRSNHPSRRRTFWTRSTILSPNERPEEAVRELWASYFDHEVDQITALEGVVSLFNCDCSEGPITPREQSPKRRQG